MLILTLLAALQLAAPTELSVLFVGNSLTSVNDVPGLVRRLAEADGRGIRVASVVANDFGFEEHWKDGRAARQIARGGWDAVVLQQGPSSLAESRVILRDYAARFSELVSKAGARPAMYMVWPSARRAADFDRVDESYALAARDIHGLLLPAGRAWREAWARDPKLPLYGADGFHASAEGSWLAALVIYCGLTERQPRDLAKLPRGFPEPRQLYLDSSAAALARR
jgi:hypothetical protein